jgi:hypothetical protein
MALQRKAASKELQLVKITNPCQELNMMFLTTARVTSPPLAKASKKFTEALHSVIPHSALTEFLGSNREF